MAETEPVANPQLASILAWIFPGAGHFYLGRRGRAAAYSALILVAFGAGCALQGNLYRVVAGQPLSLLATLAAMGVGAPYFVLRYLVGYEASSVAPGLEYGTAFLLSAGLMNLLLVLDAWDIARGTKE